MGEERKIFLRVEFQLINVEGMMAIENHLTNSVVILVAGKKVLGEARYLVSKTSPHKTLFFIMKRKKVILQWRNPANIT